ncbi:MAG: twin-arginine translocase TatA/TatE family subunit [Tidjanibacter sp.]|nr:twin-arginine translocase TatA/TatE family subunit [Tidjanibacter sp.]MBR6831208.1 twin-arginine translocase TatA/TatE family subunit [Tidjanibacter sp.]
MMNFLLIGGLGFTELLLLVVLILLLFGAKRIPELMKSIGKGMKSFKDGLNSVENTETEEPKEKKEE